MKINLENLELNYNRSVFTYAVPKAKRVSLVYVFNNTTTEEDAYAVSGIFCAWLSDFVLGLHKVLVSETDVLVNMKVKATTEDFTPIEIVLDKERNKIFINTPTENEISIENFKRLQVLNPVIEETNPPLFIGERYLKELYEILELEPVKENEIDSYSVLYEFSSLSNKTYNLSSKIDSEKGYRLYGRPTSVLKATLADIMIGEDKLSCESSVTLILNKEYEKYCKAKTAIQAIINSLYIEDGIFKTTADVKFIEGKNFSANFVISDSNNTVNPYLNLIIGIDNEKNVLLFSIKTELDTNKELIEEKPLVLMPLIETLNIKDVIANKVIKLTELYEINHLLQYNEDISNIYTTSGFIPSVDILSEITAVVSSPKEIDYFKFNKAFLLRNLKDKKAYLL